MEDRISILLSDGIAERHKARVTNHTSILRYAIPISGHFNDDDCAKALLADVLCYSCCYS